LTSRNLRSVDSWLIRSLHTLTARSSAFFIDHATTWLVRTPAM
jgi:hypothetical protein